jgi:hypothetical protein
MDSVKWKYPSGKPAPWNSSNPFRRNCQMLDRVRPGDKDRIHLQFWRFDIFDWDRQSNEIIIPFAMIVEVTYHGVNRNLKYISVIAYLFANRKSFILYIVTFQDFESFRNRLKMRGIRLIINLILKSKRKSYISIEFPRNALRAYSFPISMNFSQIKNLLIKEWYCQRKVVRTMLPMIS